MSNKPIYLDYMATTPVDPRVSSRMMECLTMDGIFGNPASSTHQFGQEAARVVEEAREKIASTLGALEADEIIFTSGATESNNLAILGAARFYQRQGKHVITVTTEHKSVLDSFKQLEREGFEVSYLAPKPDGLLDLDDLKKAVRTDTILVSVMHVNNEIGVIQDIAAIGKFLKDKGVIFHVDAAQSAGKLALNLAELPVNLMSISGHKIYGPKGVGVLYIKSKPRIRLLPISFGGGQERGMRSGTLATHQIVGLAEALFIAVDEREEEQGRILKFRERLWDAIKLFPGVILNGHEQQRLPGNLNFVVKGIRGEDLLLELAPLAISTASACSTMVSKASYVLKALGMSDEEAFSSLRISIGRFTRENDIRLAIGVLQEGLGKLLGF